VNHRTGEKVFGFCVHAIYILDKAEMNQMKGLFCVDIFVTLEIFLTKAVPRYREVQGGRFSSDVFISDARHERIAFGL